MSAANDPVWGAIPLNRHQRRALASEGAPVNDAVPAKPPLDLIWFEEIEPALDANDFVQGVLTTQGAAVVYGDSNAGKTFWTTDLALHVASGREWNGRRVEFGGVVYCVLEGGVGFRNRVAAWRKAQNLDDTFIPFAAIASQLNLLDPEADTQRLIDAIQAAIEHMGCPVKLIVIDTLSRAMAGGNENAPEDMGALVQNMDRIRQDTGAAVLFVHHSGKDAAKGARGHSLLRAAIDTEIEVVDLDGAKTATVVKQRELKKGDVFSFTLSVTELGRNRHDEPVTTCLVVHSQSAASASPVRTLPNGDPKRALGVLVNLVAQEGKGGCVGVPSSVLSVPEKWWRERFYSEVKPGAEIKAKEKAFRRAADSLVDQRLVGMANNRVWIVSYEQNRSSSQQETWMETKGGDNGDI